MDKECSDETKGEAQANEEIANEAEAASFGVERMFVTLNALNAIEPVDLLDAIEKHFRGDWGNVFSADGKQNNEAFHEGLRLISAYKDRHGTAFWIVTETDRSVRTLMLPDEY